MIELPIWSRSSSDNDRYALAWTDVAAGEFKAGEFDAESAAAELQRLGAAELLVSADTLVPQALMGYGTVTRVGPSTGATESLRAAFPDGALADLPLAEVAAGLVVRYLGETAGRGQLPPLDAPAAVASSDALQMDAVTQRHLEIVETERSRDRGWESARRCRPLCHADGSTHVAELAPAAIARSSQDRGAPDNYR